MLARSGILICRRLGRGPVAVTPHLQHWRGSRLQNRKAVPALPDGAKGRDLTRVQPAKGLPAGFQPLLLQILGKSGVDLSGEGLPQDFVVGPAFQRNHPGEFPGALPGQLNGNHASDAVPAGEPGLPTHLIGQAQSFPGKAFDGSFHGRWPTAAVPGQLRDGQVEVLVQMGANGVELAVVAPASRDEQQGRARTRPVVAGQATPVPAFDFQGPGRIAGGDHCSCFHWEEVRKHPLTGLGRGAYHGPAERVKEALRGHGRHKE